MTQYPPMPPSFGQPPVAGAAMFPAAPVKTSVLAILSLILGILGICTGITALVGIVLGIIALVQIGNSQGRLGGKGLAIAGSCVSAMAIFLSCLSIGLLLPALAKARQNAQALKARTMMATVGKTHMAYAQDHEGRYPPVDDWMNALSPYAVNMDELVTSPVTPDSGRAIAMNAKLDSQKSDWRATQGAVVVFFECRSGSPLSGGIELLPPKPRSHAGYIIYFADGHTEFVRPDDVNRLMWEP